MWNDSCRWARERLPLLAGGELAGTDRRRTERHLIGCADCRGRLASMNTSLDVLRAAAAQPSISRDAPSLWPALARQIRESRRPEPSFWSQFEIRPFASGWVPAGIAAGLLLAGGLVASWASSYFQIGTDVRTPSMAADRAAAPQVADLKVRDDAGTDVADNAGPRPEVDAPAASPSPATATATGSPRPSPKGGNGGINASVEATH